MKKSLSDEGHPSVILADEKISHEGGATEVFVEKPQHDFHYKTLTWPVGDRAQLRVLTKTYGIVRILAHDRGDRQQWDVIASLVFGCGW